MKQAKPDGLRGKLYRYKEFFAELLENIVTSWGKTYINKCKERDRMAKQPTFRIIIKKSGRRVQKQKSGIFY